MVHHIFTIHLMTIFQGESFSASDFIQIDEYGVVYYTCMTFTSQVLSFYVQYIPVNVWDSVSLNLYRMIWTNVPKNGINTELGTQSLLSCLVENQIRCSIFPSYMVGGLFISTIQNIVEDKGYIRNFLVWNFNLFKKLKDRMYWVWYLAINIVLCMLI